MSTKNTIGLVQTSKSDGLGNDCATSNLYLPLMQHAMFCSDLTGALLQLELLPTSILRHSACHVGWCFVGSKWLGKHSLDDDRPLGRGMRLKQEPAYIQDSSFASGRPLQ